MKKIFLVFTLSLCSIAAFAHSTNDMPINRMGKGTKLTFLQDINIPPLYQYFFFEKGQVVPYMIPEDKPATGCFLYMLAPASIDRIVKAGRVAEITEFGNYFGSVINIRMTQDTPFSVVCQPANITIGDFKDFTDNILEITAPNPIEVK